ncbi:LPXTG cell wall anchor domain-containing protein [Planococcus sp. CP5-4]|nr:LPXTG cell wall anchor domain-containing protein [Planococcus sp. CP5-4_YE]MBV0909154.1 LPXTG cell wall anchor domain-containing protein [Planococcus sp. CP5-4_UN]MBW6063646.1 LPXTG cell wall anchor domain-containing protein [Planococcus sp. CP5-4]
MMGEEDADMSMEGMMEEINFNELSYEMTIAKDTFYLTDMSMYVDMDISAAGESLNMVQSTDMTISNFNGVEPIMVPQDVLDNAVPLEGVIEEGGELPDTASNNPLYAFTGLGLATLGAGLLLFRRRTAAQ